MSTTALCERALNVKDEIPPAIAILCGNTCCSWLAAGFIFTKIFQPIFSISQSKKTWVDETWQGHCLNINWLLSNHWTFEQYEASFSLKHANRLVCRKNSKNTTIFLVLQSSDLMLCSIKWHCLRSSSLALHWERSLDGFHFSKLINKKTFYWWLATNQLQPLTRVFWKG